MEKQKNNTTLKCFYIGEEFPEFYGKEVEVGDDHTDPKNPCYKIRFIGETIWHDNMGEEDWTTTETTPTPSTGKPEQERYNDVEKQIRDTYSKMTNRTPSIEDKQQEESDFEQLSWDSPIVKSVLGDSEIKEKLTEELQWRVDNPEAAKWFDAYKEGNQRFIELAQLSHRQNQTNEKLKAENTRLRKALQELYDRAKIYGAFADLGFEEKDNNYKALMKAKEALTNK